MQLMRALAAFGFVFSSHAAEEQQLPLNRQHNHDVVEPTRVAIIGAGAAGASTAYHLSKYAKGVGIHVNITVFERNDYIGGRSTTVNAYDDPDFPVELGGSIFVKVNKVLVDAVNKFGLSTINYGEASRRTSSAPSLGIWNGNEFVVTLSSDGPTWWDAAKLLYRYGLSPIRTNRLMKATIGKFLKMYEEFFPFEDLTSTAQQLDLIQATSVSGDEYLHSHGVSEAFAWDIVQASSRVNYAQNLANFHGLETMVCMATDGAMSVVGGNWQIFDRMIEASAANLMLNTSVKDVGEVPKESGDGFVLTYTGAEEGYMSVDAVVIAAPIDQSQIKIVTKHHKPEPVDYVNLHVTLWTTTCTISPSAFDLPDDEQVPLTVLTTLPENEIPGTGNKSEGSPRFFSLSTLGRLVNPSTGKEENLYKVFSSHKSQPLDAALLCEPEGRVEDISWFHHKLWQSYPYETPRDRFEPTQLAENLYYTGAMDSFISTMETNALMGKNVARLLVDKLQRQKRGRERQSVKFDELEL